MIKFENPEAAARHVRPKQQIELELADGAVLHDETTKERILDVVAEFNVSVVLIVMTTNGPGTIWVLLDKVFNGVISVLNHLYGVEDPSDN